MRLRKRERVPDGPPVRRGTCTYQCETRWDREPRHSVECERLYREACERVIASQLVADAQLQAYLAFRDAEGVT